MPGKRRSVLRITTLVKKLLWGLWVIGVSTTYAQNANISNGDVFDGEPYLAINPENPQHIVVAWMGWINLVENIKIKTKSSFDGGRTWSSTVVLPHIKSGYTSADPSLDFNHKGDVFACYIDFTGTTPPVEGAVVVCKSEDGGLTWDNPREAINTEFDGTKWPIDRPWIKIDKSNSLYQGHIYVTTMNLNRTNAPFNPYLSVSGDDGNTFSTRYLDTVGWLAGSINPLPVSSPTISSTGIFYASYPSLTLTQNPFAQNFLVSSSDGGFSINHKPLNNYDTPNSTSRYPSAKKAPLLIGNPADDKHLAFIFLSAIHGDLDLFLTESRDAGITWTVPQRVNDDPIANDRMQDLIWGDFDSDGDLIVSWRDRRNGTDSTYQTDSEIWAAFREKNATQFNPNFQITNQRVSYDPVLENAGNDFMCIKMQNDTINAVWGDTRNGNLNIWFQNMEIDGSVITSHSLYSEENHASILFPNPVTTSVTIESESISSVIIYDVNGTKIITKKNENKSNKLTLDLQTLSPGFYLVEVFTSNGYIVEKIIKQ